jgi:hypothetical protein
VRHGIPSPPHEHDGEVEVLETRDPDDPLGAVGIGRVEAFTPGGIPLRRDLDDAGHELRC